MLNKVEFDQLCALNDARKTTDPYMVLGVRKVQSTVEIQDEYQRQMARYSPDELTRQGLPNAFAELAALRMELLTEAMERILTERDVSGMAEGETLHPLQQKFIDHAALQCGVCTPGILVSAKALLELNDDPSETEVRYWLAGNLCRCTGYDKIIRAVLDTAAEMRGA